jgi:hypothetical protein
LTDPLTLPAVERVSLRARVETFVPAVVCFVASRAVVFAVLFVAPVLHPGYRRPSFFSDWDAAHYLTIARSGYPQLQSAGHGFDATAAFFPLLPLLTRVVHEATRLSVRTSGVLVATAAALAAFCVIWALFREIVGARRATIALAFLAAWPASFVLSMVYSDGLLLLFAAACLLALRHERWWPAFAFSVLAGMSRPDGIVLAVCCAWAAYAAWKQTRRWLPWITVLGAPIGFAGYLAYLWHALGTPKAWYTAEHRGWHNGFDFGKAFWSHAFTALHHPTARIDLVASTLAGIVGIALVLWMIHDRLPATLTIYAAGIVGLAVGSSFGGSIPRFCLDAFPIFLVPAVRFRATLNAALIACSGAALALFMLVVELTRTTTP